MSFTGSVLSSKWDLVNVSDHFLLPPNKHTPHVACLEVVWYHRRVWEVFTHMIITLHLSTGAYCSSRKPDITIANRSSCPLRSFSYCPIQPSILLPSSPLFLPLLALSRAFPSILPFLPSHITHDGFPFPPKCQQMQMFIILVNTFDNSCEQLKGLQKRRMKLHLATEGTIMMCFIFFSAEEKLMFVNVRCHGLCTYPDESKIYNFIYNRANSIWSIILVRMKASVFSQ